jgi:hypothetical protein
MMSIIVALFMGLTVSAEEIIRDRKILKRESFLNLSWNSYLQSKVIILFSLSAIQTFSFVLLGNLILEIEWSMLLPFWFVLFSVSCLANVLGLNISSAFNSAVTVYVLIPLLLIPQMILSGLLFSFDKLNDLISTKGKVPVVADMMESRWAYEALAVHQFKNNSFEKPYWDLDRIEAQSDFRASFLVDEMEKRRRDIADNLDEKSDSAQQVLTYKLNVIRNTLKLTVEPGIYIRPDALDVLPKTPENERFIKAVRPAFEKYKGIGVRIEDDILVTSGDPVNMSAAIPRKLEDVEATMARLKEELRKSGWPSVASR